MNVWKTPPIIKVYEALGCVADARIEVDGATAKVFSSSRGKFYTVTFNAKKNAIMANDNGSYWQGYLGYPAIAFLMKKGILPFDHAMAQALAGIAWKDINTKFKNDYSKTEEYLFTAAQQHGVTKNTLQSEAQKVLEKIENLRLVQLGKQTKPPTGY